MLVKKTGQSREHILATYKLFTAECGGGEMSRTQFIKLSKVQEHAAISNQYSENRSEIVTAGKYKHLCQPYQPLEMVFKWLNAISMSKLYDPCRY